MMMGSGYALPRDTSVAVVGTASVILSRSLKLSCVACSTIVAYNVVKSVASYLASYLASPIAVITKTVRWISRAQMTGG